MVQQAPQNPWEFERVLHSHTAALIASNDQTISSLLSAAHALVVGEVRLLKNEICHACSGFGHNMEGCPTHQKLTNLGGNGSKTAVIIDRARN